MEELTSKFVDALAQLHDNGDSGPLAELFADDAILSKAGVPHAQHGRDGATAFWEDYRNVFDTIESTFENTVTEPETAFLEWKSTGTLRDGTDFSYDGVSVLEGDGEAITAFRTYYDTAAFLNVDRHTTD
jgi:ketosteroid isomerase-like protein